MFRPMTRNDVELGSRDRRWDGFFKLDQLRLRHKRYDGGWTGELTREVLERGHVVAVLPYDPVRDRLVLIEQFRPCTLSASELYPELPNWLIEIVAGVIKPGQDEAAEAIRETEEEIGMTPKKLIPVGRFFVSQGCTSETVKLFCGLIDAPEGESLHGVEDENEDIRAFTVTLDEAAAMIADGRICNASAMLAIQWLMLNRKHLPEM